MHWDYYIFVVAHLCLRMGLVTVAADWSQQLQEPKGGEVCVVLATSHLVVFANH